MKKLVLAFTLILCTSLVSAQELRTYIPLKMSAPQAQPYIKFMTRLGELTGIKFNFVDDLPQSRAKLELQKGILDVSVGSADIAYADIAADVTRMTEPMLIGRQVIVSLTPFTYTGKADLAGKTVMAVRESAPVELLMADTAVKFIEAPDNASALRMLLAGRAQLLILHETVLANTLSSDATLQKDKFLVSTNPFLEVKNYIWLAKKHSALIPKLDQAMKTLRTTGEFSKIMTGK